MTQPAAIGRGSWRLRSVPQPLADRYRSEGWWTDATLGEMVAARPRQHGARRVPRAVRRAPLAGDVRRRRPGGALARRRRCAPGESAPASVVVFQLPNWVEAGITFWAAAYLGAVVVPIVHFYGAKEVEYIVRATDPDVVVTADRFGHADHLATWGEVLGRHPVPLWLVVGDTPTVDLPAAATPFASMLDARPLPVRCRSTPTPRRSWASRPARRGTRRASCTRTARSAARPASSTTSSPPAARRRSPARPSATSSACSTPSSCRCSGCAPST